MRKKEEDQGEADVKQKNEGNQPTHSLTHSPTKAYTLYMSYGYANRCHPEIISILNSTIAKSMNSLTHHHLGRLLWASAKLNLRPVYLPELIDKLVMSNFTGYSVTKSPLLSSY